MTLAARNIRLVMELRRQNISGEVLSAIERTPREDFVPACFADQAYENVALPLPHGQTISQPGVVAFMIDALAIEPQHKVLEIGTGSGYQTAVLAQLCRRVYSMDIHRDMVRSAQQVFRSLGILNITAMGGDGSKGWPLAAPFDRIIMAAAAETPPLPLLEQLSDGGILVMPLGTHDQPQKLVRIVREGTRFTQQKLGNARFVPLQPLPQRPSSTLPLVGGDIPELVYA